MARPDPGNQATHIPQRMDIRRSYLPQTERDAEDMLAFMNDLDLDGNSSTHQGSDEADSEERTDRMRIPRPGAASNARSSTRTVKSDPHVKGVPPGYVEDKSAIMEPGSLALIVNLKTSKWLNNCVCTYLSINTEKGGKLNIRIGQDPLTRILSFNNLVPLVEQASGGPTQEAGPAEGADDAVDNSGSRDLRGEIHRKL